MSFPNYEAFQNQAGQQEAPGVGNGAPPQQDNPMNAQQMDTSVAPFQGGNPGNPGSAGGQPSDDMKTTLW
jgi:hypothetical protein